MKWTKRIIDAETPRPLRSRREKLKPARYRLLPGIANSQILRYIDRWQGTLALIGSISKRSSEVTIPTKQSVSIKGRRQVLTLLVLGCLLLLGSAALLTPQRAKATRALAGQTATSEKRHRHEFVPGEILVRFKKDRGFEGTQLLAAPGDGPALSDKGSMAVGRSNDEVFVSVERFEGSEIVEGLRLARSAPDDTLKAIAALSARDDVLYAEPNYLLHLEATPDDPQFGQLYGMNLIGAPQAWDVTQGNRNIVVAVIDEGIDLNHQDLAANIWTNPAPGSIAGISGDLHGYDFRDKTGTILAEPHATHVAGTIGAVGNNHTGVVGVNWLVSLMSLRFISAATNLGSEADAIKAYNYVKQMRDLWSSSGQTKGANIRVVNASFGGGGYSQASADAINAMGQSGVLFVAAAGNDGTNNDVSPHYPSNYSLPNVIAVTGTTQTDQQIYNYGAQSVLMGAPAVGICSTVPNNNYSCLFSGTSMATPHVAGAAALLLAANSTLTVNRLRALLAFNGDRIAALQGKTLTGRRLNVFKSLQALSENDTTPPGAVGSLQVASQSGRSINLSWIASGDDGAAGQASLYDVSFIDQNTNAVVPLTTVAPVASGITQALHINLPYRHLAGTIRVREFDNVGNEGTPVAVTVAVPLNAADPYTTANAPSSLSTGGTGLALTFDDRYLENYSLPFPFPFFGQSYNQITISTNGNLYFSPPPKKACSPSPCDNADDVPSSVGDLSVRKMISGIWDDLDLRQCFRTGADVYVVQPGPGQIIFRWQGVPFTDRFCPAIPLTDPNSFVNFEIELRSDGTISTRYGAGNINLFPVVGISGGEPDPYVIDALTSETSPKTLTNAPSAIFTPRSSCTYALVPTSQSYTAAGGAAGISVSTQTLCPWTAVSNAPWITITAGASGTGGGPVNYSVAANSLAAPRSATITIAGLTFTVNQEAAPLPVIQLASATFSANEPQDQVSISLSRTGDTSGTSTVDFTTSDTAGSQPCSAINNLASSRCDYVASIRRITFAPGEASKSVSISIINDAYQEGSESFSVSLSNPSGATLAQSTATVTIADDDKTNGPNPLADAGFFVRLQYLDFLNREPDPAGFDFWVNQITSCGRSLACTEVRRIDVSASFFLSIEFQNNGYLVERFYKVGYGDTNGNSTFGGAHQLAVPVVRFNEFLRDTQRLGQGFIVLQPGWEEALENNKQAYALEFVQTSRFTAAFPTTLTPAEFVDKLNQNAGGVLSPAERTTAINLFGGAGNSSNTIARAQAVRQVAEDTDLYNAEYNRAFVLAEYYGYLRRNPDDPPESTSDYTGYDFWLTKLNQFKGNYIDAEMVKAFLSSIEYNQRFAP
jgi:subtilisin family serine protease